jgi:hypothetical protein
MAETNINTGIKALDADLRELFDANTPKKRQEIKAAIGNYELSKEELFEVVPQAIFRVVVGLRSPSAFKMLLEGLNEGSRQHLEKAREIVEQHFVDILKHPALAQMSLGAEDDDDDDHRFASDVLNSVAKIKHMPQWKGQAPKMSPASRVAFFGVDQNILLDSVFDWDDYLFVAEALLGMLVCEMKSGKPLAELGQVELPDKKTMQKRVQAIQDNLVAIKELSVIYRFDTIGADEPTVTKNV